MYAVEVRDHIMIAHSFPGRSSGRRRNMHGATFVVDVAFFRETLTGRTGWWSTSARAHDVLTSTLKPLAYQNLDALPQFEGSNTTTEFLCRHIFDAMAAAARAGALGPGSEGIAKIRVTLHESHLARAWFEGPLGA